MKAVRYKKRAIELFKVGRPLIQVETECGVSQKTAKKWYDNWQNGTFSFEKKKGPVKPKHTKEHVKYIIKKIEEDSQITIEGLVKKIKDHPRLKNLSKGTVAKLRKPLGRISKIKAIPLLTPEHEQARLKFCLKHRNEDFKNWVFTDETIFEVKPTGNYFKLKNSKQKVAKTRKDKVKVMFWGAISYTNKYKLVRIMAKMNSIGYRQMLHEYFLQDYYKKESKDAMFQQDNASPHVSRTSIDFLKMCNLNLVDHPPCSPDLNPIETIWSWMKTQFSKFDCRSKDEVESAVAKIWKKLPQRIVRNVIDGLQKRMKHVIEIGGGFSSGELLQRKRLRAIPSKPNFERISGINISSLFNSLASTKDIQSVQHQAEQ